MVIYHELKSRYLSQLQTIQRKYDTISFLRLASILQFLITIFYYIKEQQLVWLIVGIVALILFFILMHIHNQLARKKEFVNTLVAINADEINYLEHKKLLFENGSEYNQDHHPYAYDLDIFGNHSLFQNLNRTATYIGKKTLAGQLLQLLPQQQIIGNQQAVAELATQLEWRQEFTAYAKLRKDDQAVYETLLRWSKRPSAPLSGGIIMLSFAAPLVFAAVTVGYALTSIPLLLSLSSFLFVFNLVLLGQFYKRITIEIQQAENIDKTINQYSILVKSITTAGFLSEKLKALQLQLQQSNAGDHLNELSGLFAKLDSIGNFVTTFLFNGTFLYHIHALKALIAWKKQHATALETWLKVIGEVEMLNSLANFAYNNPDFIYPELNTNFHISFVNLGHPLLSSNTRIGNDVSFDRRPFMILTGSNMSGKSTFLRSLGVNMVLAGIGSVVCAERADVHPLPVLVSMRLSDSLSDSESYFYAEIKRLKQIMDGLEERRAFVLLDEILRGTNSDDKRSGTIEVVKKMIAKNAIGAIATHDIEVCLTTDAYPEILTNKCFEAEIINDDLHFDYKLRDGICKNKSATFLMKKVGVI